MLARENVEGPPAYVLQQENTPAGCSKSSSSKAAASEGPRRLHDRTSCGPFALSMRSWRTGRAPPVLPTSEELSFKVEGLNDARTKPGERCVLAHMGWAGENREFFSILISNTCNLHHHSHETQSTAPCRPRGWGVALNCSTASLQRTAKPFIWHRQKSNMARSLSPTVKPLDAGVCPEPGFLRPAPISIVPSILRTTYPSERLTEWLSWLPLISALAAAEAIEQVSSIQVSVKWPNDLLISANERSAEFSVKAAQEQDQALSRSSESASTSTLTTMTGPLIFATQQRRYGRNGRSSSTATDCSRNCSSNWNNASMNWPFTERSRIAIGLLPTLLDHRQNGQSDVG